MATVALLLDLIDEIYDMVTGCAGVDAYGWTNRLRWRLGIRPPWLVESRRIADDVRLDIALRGTW